MKHETQATSTRRLDLSTPRKRIDFTVAFICALHGQSLASVISPRRDAPLVAVRRVIADYLIDDMKWSSIRTGKYLGRDHTTILNLRRTLAKNRNRGMA